VWLILCKQNKEIVQREEEEEELLVISTQQLMEYQLSVSNVNEPLG
jgi:hypothetical protein